MVELERARHYGNETRSSAAALCAGNSDDQGAAIRPVDSRPDGRGNSGLGRDDRLLWGRHLGHVGYQHRAQLVDAASSQGVDSAGRGGDTCARPG